MNASSTIESKMRISKLEIQHASVDVVPRVTQSLRDELSPHIEDKAPGHYESEVIDPGPDHPYVILYVRWVPAIIRKGRNDGENT